MGRPITLFTGQWADLPRTELIAKAAAWGYDGLELACWGDHFDVGRALSEPGYVDQLRAELAEHAMGSWAISSHLVGQAICDPIDERHQAIVPAHVWGDGEAEGVRRRAAEELANAARAAARLGVPVVNGFTGSPIWHKLYFFPPTSDAEIDAGYQEFADRFGPILDVFQSEGVVFALEVHPTEIAYDVPTTQRAIEAVNQHPAFQINLDPSHLVWQGVDPVLFTRRFGDRIAHVHVKDVAHTPNGACSILGGHLGFGHPDRSWDFRSPGRGDVDFENLVRALNTIGYDGPLSVEWEDSGMDREHGAEEAAAFVAGLDFQTSAVAFDAAFEKDTP
jgi:sugar phosphate isomerase/epimerase